MNRNNSRYRTPLLTIITFVILLSPGAAYSQEKPQRKFELEANSPAFWELIPKQAKLETVATGFGFTEGPVWDKSGFVYVSDEEPGFGRRKAGEHFAFFDSNGKRLRDQKIVARIRRLAEMLFGDVERDHAAFARQQRWPAERRGPRNRLPAFEHLAGPVIEPARARRQVDNACRHTGLDHRRHQQRRAQHHAVVLF